MKPSFSLLLPLAAILSFQASARSATEVLWVTEPKQISISKDNLNTIDVDGATSALITPLLTGYVHKYMTASVRRALKIVEESDLACAGNKVITEERSKYSLSPGLPQVVFPGIRLYVNEAESDLVRSTLNGKGEVELDILLKLADRFQLGITQGRAYGEAIDPILNDVKNQGHLWSRAGQDMSAALNNMFLSGRLDMILEYPNVLQHYKSLSQSRLSYSSYPIAGMSPFILGYYLCSNSEQGTLLVAKLDKVLRQVTKQRAYLDAHLRWFDESLWPDLVTHYNEVYGTEFKLPEQR